MNLFQAAQATPRSETRETKGFEKVYMYSHVLTHARNGGSRWLADSNRLSPCAASPVVMSCHKWRLGLDYRTNLHSKFVENVNKTAQGVANLSIVVY